MVYVEIEKVEDVVPNKKSYIAIPSPEIKTNETKEDFEEKMIGLRKPITLPLYPNIFSLPEFIYYQNTIYQVSLKKTLNLTSYIQDDFEDVKYHPAIDEFFTNTLTHELMIYYILSPLIN